MTQPDSDTLARLLAAATEPETRRILASDAAFRLYSRLDSELHLAHGNEPLTLLMASAQSGEGRSTLATLLAGLTAAYDPARRILLADCDVTSNQLARAFGRPAGEPGLHEWMCGVAPLAECQRSGPLPNLQILPGCGAESPRNKFNHNRFAEWAALIRQSHDLVIIDSPAARDNRDVISAAKVIGNVMVLVKYRGPYREQVQALLAELRGAGANILGVVLNERMFPVPRLFYGR
jgi:Mrp family chromosome partitioning ATPase